MTSAGTIPPAFYKSRCIVADLDNTLVRGRIANGIGRYFLQDELKRLHLLHMWLGLKNYGEVKRRAEEYGEAAGLEYFGGIVGKTGCATVSEFYRYAQEYIQKHSLPGAVEFMTYFGERMPTFISTMGVDLAAAEARAVYKCRDALGQPVYHGNGTITKIGIMMRDGKDKMEATEEMLRKHNLTVSESAVLGNDALDHDSMRAARIAIASPLADAATIELAGGLEGFHIEDYKGFMKIELFTGMR